MNIDPTIAPNEITGANAGGLRWLPTRALCAARIAQFWCYRRMRTRSRVSIGIARCAATALVLVAIPFASSSPVLADDAPAYSGLKPGQFMRQWLVLKPIPFRGRDEAAERRAFAEDY